MNLPQDLLKSLLPLITVWAETVRFFLPHCGRRLVSWELEIARKVGVRHPERIKLIMVDELPFPDHPRIRELAGQYGLGGPGMRGLTLGYGVFILEGHYSVRILSHECRHVAQYEEAGSVGRLLNRYLAEVMEHGYRDAPLEQDARAHEISNVMKGGRTGSPPG